MAKEITTEILIMASPAKVWSVIMDFERYPSWNPFITSIQGKAEVGQKISIRLEPPGAKSMRFKPQIKQLTVHREFRWLGHFLFPGLFDGEHRFLLVEEANGHTRLIHSEVFKGILVPLFKKMLEKNTLKGFEAMNQRLKERAESL